jgi:hypothetical protein
MTDLDDRIRRLYDRAAPVTLDEVRQRHARPARSRKTTTRRRGVMAVGAAVAVIVAVVVAVAAARHDGKSTTVSVGIPSRTGPARTGPARTGPARTGPARAVPPRTVPGEATTTSCVAADLSLRVGSFREAAGQFEQTLTFTNQAGAVCQLAGWPTLVAFSPGHPGQRGNIHVRQNLPPQPAWRAVSLHPGGTASFDFAGGDYNNVTSQACPMASSVTVIPPGSTKPLRVRLRFPDCGALEVTPIVAGANDPEAPGETVPTATSTTQRPPPPAEPADRFGLIPVVRATRLAPSVPSRTGPRYLAPGTAIPAGDIAAQVRATPQVSYGLADVGGSEWPAISTDGGQTWRIDGPLFVYPAESGANAANAIGALSANVAYAWGHGGNFVKITYDAGGHWWLAAIPGQGVESVTRNKGTLRARTLGPQTATGQFETFLYISSDQGRTWTLHGQLGDVQY